MKPKPKRAGYLSIERVKSVVEAQIRASMIQLMEHAGSLGYPRTAGGVKRLVKQVTHDSADYCNLMVDGYLISSYLNTSRTLGLQLNNKLENDAGAFAKIF